MINLMNTLHLKAYIKFKQNALENQHGIATRKQITSIRRINKKVTIKIDVSIAVFFVVLIL